MRVLAIRGRNLASLAGDFAVDFEAEPLADAGIFAITGPTGAGKSTLLDAMCLALFDAVPRLGAASSRGRVETVQGDELTAADPRAILRHGEGEGYAEIDFVGRDGDRYRARWQVQRARQKADGKMQASKQSLIRLSDQQNLSDKKGETLKAIHDLVGLSAEQFRRAVLLAQGDFEAFIRADENERAMLLERLTGSQIYTTLGKAAFTKANELRGRQQGLLERIAAQNGLDDAARAEAEAKRDTAQAGAEAAALLLGGLEAGARWETDRATLAGRIATCEADAARTASAVEEAKPRRETLRRAKMALGFAAEWTALGEARQAAEAARTDAAARATALETAAGAIVAAEDLDRQARDAMAAETARAAKLDPDLDRARMLDRQIGETEAMLAKLADTRTERADRLARGRTAEAEASELLANMTVTRDDHAAWLADHAAFGPLAAREAELAADCDEHRAVADRLDALARDEARARAEQDKAAQALAKASEALTAAETAQGKAQAALIDAESKALSPAMRTAIEARRDALTALRPLLLDARNKAERADEHEASLRRLRDEQASAETERAALTEVQAAIADALPALRHRLDEAKRAGALAEAASDEAAGRLRATLIDGEPCPVCGATDHALTAIGDLLGRQLAEQRERIATLDAEIGARNRDDAATASQLATLARQAQQRAAETTSMETGLATAVAARDAAHALLADKSSTAGLDSEDAAFEQRLTEALAEAEAERRAMEAALAALAQARTAESEARALRDTARTARDAAAERQRAAGERLSGLAASIAHARETLDRLARALDAGLGAAADWRALADPRAWLATQAGAWRERSVEQAEIVAALPRFEQALADARTATAEILALANDIETQAATLQTTRDTHAKDRGALLGGKPVAEVETLRASALARLHEDQTATQATLAKAREDHASAAAHRQAADQAAARTAAAHARRNTEFRARIATQSLGEAEVAAGAAQGAAPIEREEAALAALDTAARDAANALAQRHADLAAHEARDRPTLTGEALADAMAQARIEAETVRAALTEAQFALRRDDEVRAQTAALRTELERERETSKVWLALSGLIGDAEGKKFRRFAQGLTLDRLLAHANARLAELKPRYALERGAGADMLIQVVDHDMAGEVRGVHNLSGGERFLISLALALGLAEMSTGRGLRIESLFIDEGFGALDTASLGQAIAVLEHLHASGRRVGVISHVEEVKERIPVKIEVTPVSRGKSALSVVAG